MKFAKYTIHTGMGRVSDPKLLPFLTKEEFTEFNHVGYTGKDINGDRSSYEKYLNSLGKGDFTVETLQHDNAEFTATYLIIRAKKNEDKVDNTIPVVDTIVFQMISIIVEAEEILKRVQALKLNGVIACDIDDVLFSISQYKKHLDKKG
jgi:hypothetical protein